MVALWFDHSDALRSLWRVAFLLPAAGLHHGSHGAVSLLAHPGASLRGDLIRRAQKQLDWRRILEKTVLNKALA